ncbi:MAG TPA: hypothetical protein H9881_01855 [Candidatus Stackebrandtia excrementipullorum]|nr:hypothetical protein [Candidatus Stackebrandtia excrementipullorum]
MRSMTAALSVGLVLAISACGLQPASQFIPDVEPGERLKAFGSLEGVSLVTTSKDFTEQLILGKILTLVLSAMGADVVDRTNAKGSVNARESLLRGDADLMWEYTGTGWVNYLGHVDGDAAPDGQSVTLSDPTEVFEAVAAEDLAENDVFWSEPAPFNNTFAIAVTREDADTYSLESLGDIASVPQDRQTFCLENEFESRTDGWPGMKDAYGFDIPGQNTSTMDSGIIYSQIGDGCVFGVVLDTDGRILGNDLVTLTDDRGFFPIYEPSVTIRRAINDEYPEIAAVFEEIGRSLNTDTMRELNNRVDVEGRTPVSVAEEWLVQEGFLAEAG